MTPGMKRMVGFVKAHMKLDDIKLNDNELVERYRILIHEHEINSYFIIMSQRILDMTAKAVRIALLKAFTEKEPEQKSNHKNISGHMVLSLEDAKKSMRWGTFGIDGNQPLEYVRLVDCSTEHLEKILVGQRIDQNYRNVISSILEDRK